MNKILKILNRYEPFAYALIVLLNSLPIFIGKYFPSMDGPAHLHNSLIIQELIFGGGSIYSSFYEINTVLIPNWLGHIFLVIGNWFFQPNISEKILLLVISIGFPVVGRLIINKLNPENRIISYLFLPFVYATSFIYGFYNFSIGILLFLVILYYWLLIKDKLKLGIGQFILFFILFVLTYFSHALVFLIAGGSIGLFILIDFFKSRKYGYNQFLNRVLVLSAAALVPLLFFLDYSLGRGVLEASSSLAFGVLIDQLVSLDMLIGYNASLEKPYLTIIFLVLIFLFSVQAYDRFKDGIGAFRNSDYWLMLSVFILLGYFILPNTGGGAGFISMRLSYLFFTIVIIWISSHKVVVNSILLVVVPLSLFANWKMISYYTDVSIELNRTVASIEEVAKRIPEGSLVVPIDFSRHCMMNHFSNYLAIDKDIVVLDNYESTLYYFPTQMKMETFPNTTIGDIDLGEKCTRWIRNSSNPTTISKFVFILGAIENTVNECDQLTKEAILANYKLDYKNEHCSLYILI